MRLKHFHELRPVCLVCRGADHASAAPLTISHALREQDDVVIEGLLRCSNEACQFEYPIIDGIPFILPNLREYLSANAVFLQARTDLSDTMLSVLGDCCGPGSSLEIARQQIASYSWGHYGDLDPRNDEPDAGSTVAAFRSFGPIASGNPDGPVLDIGCSVGRIAFELAAQTERLTLGIDINAAMIRVAASAIQQGVVSFPHRHVGLVYETRKCPIETPHTELVDFWACDATTLPFADQSFSHINCLNTLDSIHSPLGLLQSIARVTQPAASVHLGCPYDWSAGVTPIEGWIGGHSQRAFHEGRSETLLAGILSEGVEGVSGEFQIESESQDVPWVVRMHNRSRMHYSLHALNLRRR